MAVVNPTANYGWTLPNVGGSIGVWGALLNAVFGEDGASGEVKGVDQVVHELQQEVDTLEVDVADLDTRVSTIEQAGVTAFYARINRSTDQSIIQGQTTLAQWENTDFDEGNLTVTANRLTVPAGAAGLWQIRAVLSMRSYSDGDDSFRIQAEIRKTSGGTPSQVALSFVPHLNDGFNSDSGNVTLVLEIIDVAEDGDYYEVYVFAEEPGGDGSPSATLRGGTGTYFEAVRLAPGPSA